MDERSRGRARQGRHALIAGGGSGGHVFPGLAVAEVLLDRGWRVSWLGRGGGIEERLAGARGLDFHALAAAAVTGRGTLARGRSLAVTAVSAWRARGLVRRLQGAVLLGTGGYVSAPAVLGARLAGRPALLLEPNARPGLANRWLSRWARGAALAGPESAAGLACPVRATGVPVRAAFHAEPSPLPAAPRLLVLGGSQGARQLNELLPPALELLAAQGVELGVLHQTGAAHLDAVRADYAGRALSGIAVETAAFLDDVARAMAGAQLVVSRAGAVTLAEISAAGRAALLVPLALAGGHQRDNAAAMAEAGAAEMLERPGAAALAERLGALVADRERLAEMGRRARERANPGAAGEIADWLEELAVAP